MKTEDLDTGAAKIRSGSHVGHKVHAVRPPVGAGLVCDPTIEVDRLVKSDGPITCKVCISSMESEK